MQAVLDLVRVLFDPAAVFQRVREKPRFLAPFLGLSAVQLVVGIFMLPYTQVAMRTMAQGAGAAAGRPDPSQFAAIGLLFVPVGVGVSLLIAALLLWVLTALFGQDAKFTTLLSVAAYAGATGALLAIAGAASIALRGQESVTSMLDLQPALGLDLLVPGASGFTGALLKAVNPFSIWGLVLTAIGINTTHQTARGTGYAIATVAFLLGAVIGAALTVMFAGRSA